MNLIATGLAIGLDTLEGLEFEPDKPFRACLICGAIYQTQHDRSGTNELWAAANRDAWARKHSIAHSDREHRMLQLSGLCMTPLAAQRLAAFGVIPVLDAVTDDEVAVALFESSPIPQDDAEC